MKFSIITINYNNFEGLKRTVESVVNQTWKDFEYIIIDGGSTDGSVEYIETQRQYVDYWISEPDKGIYSAMNKGIAKATGEYLLFLNSGDEFYDAEVLESNNLNIHTEDLVYFDIQLISEDQTKVYKYPELLDYKNFIGGSIGHPTTFIKKELFSKNGNYDESLKIVSDWKFFMTAILKHNCSWRKVNKVLSKFHMDGVSSTNMKLVNEERDAVLKECFPEYLRLHELEFFLKQIKKSRTIKMIQKFGLLRFVNKFK